MLGEIDSELKICKGRILLNNEQIVVLVIFRSIPRVRCGKDKQKTPSFLPPMI